MSDGTINVTGIQGNPVSPGTPSDGDVLTWDETDGYWVGRSGKLTRLYFTSSGTWTCPPGVNFALITAAGGGGSGGGSAAITNAGGAGGGGSIQQTSSISVVPGANYIVTIGNGGIGQGDGSNVLGDGESTTITNGSNIIFQAVGGGGGGSANSVYNYDNIGGFNFSLHGQTNQFTGGVNSVSPGFGGGRLAGVPSNGLSNWIGNGNYNGGLAGASNGGSGGGAGAQGSGASGGDGGGLNGSPGSDAGANTGAGGGAAGWGTSTGNTGGNGGSGYLFIIF